MTRLIPIGWAAALFVLLSLFPRLATAQTGADTGYSLVVDSDPPTAVSFDRLAAMLSSDLGAPVKAEGGKVAIAVRYRDRKLMVRADHGQGRVLERTIEVDEATAEREASLLASNMARDEASEVLDALEARRRPEKPVADKPPAATQSKPEPPNVYASAGLLYPLATNWGKPDAKTYVDFSLFYGRVGTVQGAQIGSFASDTSDLYGAQVAGFASIARNEAHGVQTAGALAFAREIDGVQAAPFNIAHDVNGLQFGVINIAKNVKGTQIGAINIADEVDGVQLGAVSISRNGVHPIVFASNLAYTNIGLKFSTKWVYTTFALTYGTLETDFENLGTNGALGGHIPLDVILEHLDVEPEVAMISIIPRTSGNHDNNLWMSGRITAGYNFATHLRVFAGGGARFPLIVHLGREVVRPEMLAGVQF